MSRCAVFLLNLLVQRISALSCVVTCREQPRNSLVLLVLCRTTFALWNVTLQPSLDLAQHQQRKPVPIDCPETNYLNNKEMQYDNKR